MRYPDTTGNIIPFNLSDQVTATERAIRPEAVALAVFAGLTGLIALAVIGQLLSRQLALDAAEFPILRALGVRRAALVTLSLARLGIVTVTGAIVAVAVAIAASPLMPIGPARLAEPYPGVEVNLAILGAGFAAIALLPLAVLTPSAWRAARQAQGPLGLAEPTARQSRPSRLAAALTRAGSVTGGAGVAMAFEPGHGRTAVPVRSALAGSVIAVAALAAAAVFGASLVGLVGTPHDYGQNWVQEVDLNFGTASGAQAAQLSKDHADRHRERGRQLRAAHHRQPDRARDRPRPGTRRRLPHATGWPRADRTGRDRPRRADAPRDRRAPRADHPGHGQPGRHQRPRHPAPHARRRRRHPARVQPWRLHPHRAGHRGSAAGNRAVQSGAAQATRLGRARPAGPATTSSC